MKIYLTIGNILLLVAFMALGHKSAIAQSQDQVIVQIHPPPPNQLSMADLWRISLISNSRVTIEVQLHGTVEAEREGLIGSGRSSVFMIQPGMNRLTGRHVEPVTIDYADNRYRDALLRTGGVPPGDYTLCIQVVEPLSGRELGRDCITHRVESFSPPELISPVRGISIRPHEMIFTWTPITPIARELRISYDFRLVQMMGDQPAEVAIQSNPAWYEERTNTLMVQMTGTSPRYNRPDPGMYAWVVVARDQDSDRILGRSEISFFTIEDDTPWPEIEVAAIATHGLPLGVFQELLTPCSGNLDTVPLPRDERIIIKVQEQEMEQFQIRQMQPSNRD
jgi:hypothetical protein